MGPVQATNSAFTAILLQPWNELGMTDKRAREGGGGGFAGLASSSPANIRLNLHIARRFSGLH